MKQKSFTLIELLVVIAIIGILSGFVYVQVNNAMNTGKDAKRKSDIQLLASGINNYLMESISLPVSSECTINGTCSSEINEAFESQLGSLPSDPDSGQYYTYESDGTDCAISSVLSTGETYQYTCSDDTIATVNTPVDGVCGSSDGQNLSSIPSTNLCSIGTASSVSGSGPWTWTCSGLYEGDDASCSTGEVPTAGVCGTASKLYAENDSSYGSDTFCVGGTASPASPSFPNKDATVSWTCPGSSGGDSVNCGATRVSSIWIDSGHGFQVMQYEVRNINGVAISAPVGPYYATTLSIASSVCSALGAHLITNAEWTTLARDMEGVASNWSGGSVGSGAMARGWAAEPSTDSWNNAYSAPTTGSSCLYNVGADTCGSSGLLVHRRTLYLSNGNFLWDFAGNLFDRVLDNFPFSTGTGYWAAGVYSSDWSDSSLSDYEKPTAGPIGSYTVSNGVGGYSSDDCAPHCGTVVSAYRGGYWGYGAYSGPFSLYLPQDAEGTASPATGFRCVK